MRPIRVQKTLRLGIFALLAMAANSSHAEPSAFNDLYGELLSKYWLPETRINGIRTTVFDYARMKQDAGQSNSLFIRTTEAIERVNPAQFQDKNEAKAFWINAYNLAAMRLVIDQYPVDSIRSLRISLIKYPWSKKAIRIGKRSYTLRQIEKEILLKQFNDPRVVFAVSCAAVSCPDVVAEPFVAERLNGQLDAMIRHFFTNPGKGLRLDRLRRILTLSWTLEKDRHLFEDDDQSVLGFVLPYLEPDIRQWLNENVVAINYFEHDWTLNDQAQED